MKSIVSNKKMKTATKMYLSIILSMVCVMFYQYQLSNANFITWQGGGGPSNNGILSTNRSGTDPNEVLLKKPNPTKLVNAQQHTSDVIKLKSIDANEIQREQNSLELNSVENASVNLDTSGTRSSETIQNHGSNVITLNF